MNDKESFPSFIEEHAHLFGLESLGTVTADKGYFSKKNKRVLEERGVSSIGLQKPGKDGDGDMELKTLLYNRRAGIEPLIGHAKHGGQLGRSRMKSDAATLAAGYGSILGMNLRQIIRHAQGKYNHAA